MKGDLLPPNHHIARLCQKTHLVYKEDKPVGVMETAFRARSSEEAEVSAYWLEFYRGDYRQNILSILSTVKTQIRRNQRLAIINVSRLNTYGIQVVEDPIYAPPPETNVAHVILRGIETREIRTAVANLISPADIVGIDDFVQDVEKTKAVSFEQDEPSCYLSAPANVDTGALRNLLADLGVRVSPPAELPPPGESLPGEIRRSLRDADFVCGILADEPSAATNVAFELGIAAGLSRPLFVIANKHASFPFGLQAFPYVQGNSDDVDAIRFHLTAFLKNIRQSARAALTLAKPTREVSTPGLDTIADLRRRARNPNPSELEISQVVSQALMALGAEVTVESTPGRASRPDAIAWFPEAIADLGGPLVIEVKRSATQETTAQMERYMAASRARAGLLVSLDFRAGIDVRILSRGYLFIISLSTLLNLAETGRLIPDLIRARNRFVHTGH